MGGSDLARRPRSVTHQSPTPAPERGPERPPAPRSGGEDRAAPALPPAPARHRTSPAPARGGQHRRASRSERSPRLSFPRGRPACLRGRAEERGCRNSRRALRPQEPPPTPQADAGGPGPRLRETPAPPTHPPCERRRPPAASRSPGRRPGRPASPQGSSPPAAPAVPAWKPGPPPFPPPGRRARAG